MTDFSVPTSLDQLDPDVASVVKGAAVILVPVDDGSDAAIEAARRVATALAGLAGARLVLLDRHDTTYADTPRIFELDRDEVASIDRPYLLAGIDEAAEQGVTATAFQHSLPGDEAISDAAARMAADVLVVPAKLKKPSLLSRLKTGGTTVRAEEAAPAGTAVLVVADDGTVSDGGEGT